MHCDLASLRMLVQKKAYDQRETSYQSYNKLQYVEDNIFLGV